MKSMSPIPSSKEEKPQLVLVCNQGEFFVEPKEIKQGVTLEEVSTTIEIPKKVDKSLDKCQEVGHDELFEKSPPVEDIPYHGAYILHGFEDPFVRKESDRDESFNFFMFISPTISTWALRVPRCMPNFITNRTLKDFLHGSKSRNYGSMGYVYGWMMEEH